MLEMPYIQYETAILDNMLSYISIKNTQNVLEE